MQRWVYIELPAEEKAHIIVAGDDYKTAPLVWASDSQEDVLTIVEAHNASL